jgi:hypothetical protein
MVGVLEKAIEELNFLPPEDQEKFGNAILNLIHSPVPASTDAEEEEWDKMTSSPESLRFLDHMLKKVDDSISNGDIYPDPSDVLKFNK